MAEASAPPMGLEVFATLQAALREPFAPREEVLLAAGVDEATLVRAERHWKEALAAPDAEALRERFRAAWRGDPPAPPAPAAAEDEPAPTDAPAVGAAPSERPPVVGRVVPSYLQPTPVAMASDVDETLLPVRRAGPTLPFARAIPGAIPTAAQEQRGAASREPPPASDGDETAFLPTAALVDAPPLPFDGPRRSERVGGATTDRAPWISLEAYAAFLAAFRMVSPSDAPALRRRFGIGTEDDQRALGAAFAARFARQPRERATFDALLARHRGENR